ncbi:MAG: plasmid pRiA4b ORF-3 family protein [Bacteroidales bacterium]
MNDDVYQVQFALRGIVPRIWRRLLIPSGLLLRDFHKIIQSAMGWENRLEHRFIRCYPSFFMKIDPDDFWYTMAVSSLLEEEGEKMVYEYDYTDQWKHDIILEKILPAGRHHSVPTCLAGARNCPPEGCGGAQGYTSLLAILTNPFHALYDDVMLRTHRDFDPCFFEKDFVNLLFQQDDYGCADLSGRGFED